MLLEIGVLVICLLLVQLRASLKEMVKQQKMLVEQQEIAHGNVHECLNSILYAFNTLLTKMSVFDQSLRTMGYLVDSINQAALCQGGQVRDIYD
jgi:hypothetical protein